MVGVQSKVNTVQSGIAEIQISKVELLQGMIAYVREHAYDRIALTLL